MSEAGIIGVDLAKSVFQLHGAAADGRVVFRKKVMRGQFRAFLEARPRCMVAMEACGSSHYWGRLLTEMGHDVRIIPPAYVKPFVKRQKNDAADAEALAEAAVRPGMRFVPIKSQAQQAQAMALKTRDLLVRQRNQITNALRGHLMEFGVVAAAGRGFVNQLANRIATLDSNLPVEVVDLSRLYLEHLAECTARIVQLERRLARTAKSDPEIARLRTIPGIGMLSALALKAFAPPMQTFKRGRDFAAWLGLVPTQRSTGGKQRLGRTSKMGQRDIRRLLIIGAMSKIRWAARKGAADDLWLMRMLERKPRLLVAVALANRTARAVWAMMTKGQDYRPPAAITTD